MTATCRACGQQWPRHPVLEVPCPSCEAREDVSPDAVWGSHSVRVAKLKVQATEDEGISAKRLGAVTKQITGLPEKARKVVEQVARLDDLLNPPDSAPTKAR
jgi:hypothetical protein